MALLWGFLFLFLVWILKQSMYLRRTPNIWLRIILKVVCFNFSRRLLGQHNVLFIVFYLNMLGSMSFFGSSHWRWWIWSLLSISQSLDLIVIVLRTRILSILIRWCGWNWRWRCSSFSWFVLTQLVLRINLLYFLSLLEHLWFFRIAIFIICAFEIFIGWLIYIRVFSLFQLITLLQRITHHAFFKAFLMKCWLFKVNWSLILQNLFVFNILSMF